MSRIGASKGKNSSVPPGRGRPLPPSTPIDVRDEDAELNAAVDAVVARDRSILEARKRARLESASSSDANSSVAAFEAVRDEILRDNEDLQRQGVADLSNVLTQSMAVMQQQLASGLAAQVSASQEATLARMEQMLVNLAGNYDARLDSHAMRLRDL